MSNDIGTLSSTPAGSGNGSSKNSLDGRGVVAPGVIRELVSYDFSRLYPNADPGKFRQDGMDPLSEFIAQEMIACNGYDRMANLHFDYQPSTLNLSQSLMSSH